MKDDEDTPSAESSSSFVPSEGGSQTPPTEPGPVAPAEGSETFDIGPLVAKARRIWPNERMERRLAKAARRYSAEWVDRALDVAAKKAESEPVGWGLVLTILDNWRKDGAPSPAAASIDPAKVRADALKAEVAGLAAAGGRPARVRAGQLRDQLAGMGLELVLSHDGTVIPRKVYSAAPDLKSAGVGPIMDALKVLKPFLVELLTEEMGLGAPD